MGNSPHSLELHKKYDFITIEKDPTFKNVKIYRNKQPNYDYVMLIDSYISCQNKTKIQQQLARFKQQYFQCNSFNLIRILDFSIRNENRCNYSRINICLQYLRHSLFDYLSWRKQNQSSLRYDQIIMAICSAIEVYQKTYQYQFIVPSLRLSEICITHQGCMRFNPIVKNLSQYLILPFQNTCQNIIPCKSSDKQYKKSQIKHIHSYLTPVRQISHKQHKFLLELKHFANEIVWDNRQSSSDSYDNPQDQYYSILQKKQIKRLLKCIHLAKTVKQLKQIVRQPVIQGFLLQQSQSTRLSHEQSEAKLQKIVTQLSQRTMEEVYDKRQYHKISVGRIKQHYPIF